MKKEPKFIHLRLHSEYSLLEGAIPVKQIGRFCKNTRMPAVAVTDTNNMFAALEFSTLVSAEGVQPIIGCQIEVNLQSGQSDVMQSFEKNYLVLLVQNDVGYNNLLKLNSLFYLGNKDSQTGLSIDDICSHNSGLICLTGGANGPIGQLISDGHKAKAHALLEQLENHFPQRVYVEIQRHPISDGHNLDIEIFTEKTLVELAYELELPLVATNDVYFPSREMFEAHDALICIGDGTYVDQKEERRRFTTEHYFKTQEEMVALFADLPEAVKNTVEIAKRCSFKANVREPILPKFADNEVEVLRLQAAEGLNKRLSKIEPVTSEEEYKKRLDFELKIIEEMGFPGYFLIVADFIKWAKSRGIPVGPGRGSGAGSLVAYSLTITDLDPLRYSLLFERFLNPERVSIPDFDIDFCMDRREEVIHYVQEKYGNDKVGQIITFGALLSKMAIRDIGRVLQMPYGQVDRLSKLIPLEGVRPVSIKKALADEPKLKEEANSEEVVGRMLTYAQQVEGLLRNAATHAAGIVIGDRPLDELVPLYQDPRSEMPATQFNMKWVEQAGLVKFDFLGLKTLTVVQNAVDLLKLRNLDIDIGNIPLNDKATYDLYSSAKTVAVFQVESAGMMDALRRMKPTCIEDIVALVALYRPGPMENIPAYCEVKNGQRSLQSIHPLIDHILEETQGIIVYQEQVMQIAQLMGGYSLGGADLLRRAMGKKIKEAMDAERPKFETGAAKKGVDKQKAKEVFDLLEKFANYGFNKSHAAAYAVVSYQTAWLKANYPVEFMAAVMNCDIHLTEKLNVYKQEVERLGIQLFAPCINKSASTFSVFEQNIYYALGGLKNIGVEAMEMITKTRGNDLFINIFDFARRVNLKRVGRRPLEMLTRAGAFDVLDSNRQKIFNSIDALINYSTAVNDEKSSSQVSLFGDSGEDLPEPRLSKIDDWLPMEKLSHEHMAVGFYLSGHPLDDYKSSLKRNNIINFSEVEAKVKNGASIIKIAGSVTARQERKSARGNRYAFVQLSDPTGIYEVTMFSDVLEISRSNLEPGDNVVLTVDANIEGGQLKMLARSVQLVDKAILSGTSAGLCVYVNEPNVLPSVASVLERAKKAVNSKSIGPIRLYLMHPSLPGEVEMELKGKFPVTPEIKGALKSLGGVVEVEDF